MTIARRRPGAIDAIAPIPTAPVVRPPMPEMEVPIPLGDAPAPDTGSPVGRLRRCVFRRIDRVSAGPGRSEGTGFEVMCLYGGQEALPIGDLAAARPICDACAAPHIFRPDED